MRFMDSPNKLMLIYQLARPENQASLTYISVLCFLRP